MEYTALINSGESEILEFKKTTRLLKEGIISICAFANKSGGRLIFGVQDDGKILGQTVSDDTLKNIANSIKLNTEPRLFPQVEKVKLEGKSCVLVTIEESPLKPHTAYGRPYIRVGSTNQQMDQGVYSHYLEAKYNGYGFDQQLEETASISDIDEDTVLKFLDMANNTRNLNESLYLPIQQILEKLELVKTGNLTRAAILLFGKRPAGFFDGHYEVKCGSFTEEKGYDLFTSNQEYSANLFSIFDSVFAFVMDRLEKRYIKRAKNGRSEWEIPTEVIREAIVNMLIHKDYRQGVKSMVEVRPSYIRFYNSGHLFKPIITEENLLKPHPSKPGNKLIAKTFFWAGLAETWGSGTLKIVETMRKMGKPTPTFKHKDGMFELKIFR